MEEIIQGLICLWEISIPFVFAEKNLEKRNINWFVKVIWVLGMALNLALLVVQRNLIMYSRWYLFVVVPVTSVLILLRYRVKLLDAIIGISIYFESIYIFDLFLLVFLGNSRGMDYAFIPYYNVTWERILIYIIGRVIVSGVIFIINKKKFMEYAYSGNRSLFMFIPIIQYIGMDQCDWIFYGEHMEVITSRNIILFLFIYFFILFMTLMNYVNRKNKYEKEIILEKNRMMETECERIVRWNQERDILIHDFKNHMLILERLIEVKETERALEYIHKLTDTVLKRKKLIKTGNIIIDALLEEKASIAKEKDIVFEVVSDDMSNHFIEDHDWCIILANLLDNAIEACEKVEGEKGIKVRLENFPYGTGISIANNFSQINMKNGRLVTTKKDKLSHGLGSQSVDNVVRKYKGTIDRNTEDGLFTVDIILFQ